MAVRRTRAAALPVGGLAVALAGLLAGPSGSAEAAQVCDAGTGHGLSAPTDRFVDNADGTVTDGRAGLMWMRCAAGQRWAEPHCAGAAAQFDAPQAEAEAAAVNASGAFFYNDWRLPKAQELAMISERACRDPRINLTVFPDTPADFFWTASPRPGPSAAGGGAVFVLSFGAQGIAYADRTERFHVRLVRHAR